MKVVGLISASVIALGLSTALASAEPLKVAVIEAFSGPTAQTTIPFVDGMRYGFKKINDAGGFNGEPVIVTEYDSLNQPATAAEKLKAALADGAHIIIQAGSSAIGAQLSEDIRKYNLRNEGNEVIFFNEGSESHQLTAQLCHFWFFKTSSNPFIRIKALGRVMKDAGTMGSKVYSINQNYSYGQEHEAAQRTAVELAGSTIVGSVLHDTSKIQDFSPYVAQIKASGADTVLSGNWGNDIILLMRAISDAGLHVQVGNTSIDTTGAISAMGEAALGANLVKLYNLEAGGEAGKVFAEDFKAVIGHYPYSEEPTSAFGTLLLGEALKSLSADGGEVNTLKIALALETASYEAPTGTWSMRAEDHQTLMPVTVSQVSKDALYPVDGTDMGFKLVAVVPPELAAVPVDDACKMQRPAS
jgi:branched-chain amino acid transport system substrate-binding protein